MSEERDQDTRIRLIEAGLELFALNGFAAVTTRQLSAAAKANQSAIPYYFNGKKGLYLAVAGHVAEQLSGRLSVAMTMVQNEAAKVGDDREALSKLLEMFVRNLVEKLVADPRLRIYVGFMLREVTNPGLAFDTLYEGMWIHFNKTLGSIVAAACHLPPDSQEVVIRAHGLTAMLMSLGAGKQVICRRLGWEDYDEQRIIMIATQAVEMASNALGLSAGQGAD